MGNILRYLKCCTHDPNGEQPDRPRYPNLQQVFITSETYGGYANGQGTPRGQETKYTDCLLEEPFAYEGGFAVQRTILAQINQTPNQHTTGTGTLGTGSLNYTPDANLNNLGDAPWFDWGPYLWISGETRRSDGLVWCGGQNDSTCNSQSDVRDGDPNDSRYPGDYTHPRENGLGKVANQLVNFIYGNTRSPFLSWIVPK